MRWFQNPRTLAQTPHASYGDYSGRVSRVSRVAFSSHKAKTFGLTFDHAAMSFTLVVEHFFQTLRWVSTATSLTIPSYSIALRRSPSSSLLLCLLFWGVVKVVAFKEVDKLFRVVWIPTIYYTLLYWFRCVKSLLAFMTAWLLKVEGYILLTSLNHFQTTLDHLSSIWIINLQYVKRVTLLFAYVFLWMLLFSHPSRPTTWIGMRRRRV